MTYRITSIEPQKRYPNRSNIYLDDAFAFGLDNEVVLKFHLHAGDEIEEEKIENLIVEEERVRAKQKALALLSYRARSVEELRGRLLSRGYDETIVSSVIGDYLKVGLLDDAVFASSYVQTRMLQKPMGKRLLIRELKQKGITEAAAERALAESYGQESELEVALRLAESRLRRVQRESVLGKKKKISDFLVRRGFDWDVVQEVLQRILENE
jgi:regulatory protein